MATFSDIAYGSIILCSIFSALVSSNDGLREYCSSALGKYSVSFLNISIGTCGTTVLREVNRVIFVLKTGLCFHGPSAWSI